MLRNELFPPGLFTLHNGQTSDFKIECDALSYREIDQLAWQIAKRVKPFYQVYGIPRGGVRLADALRQYNEANAPHFLIVDDVLTTGASMEEAKQAAAGEVIGAVIFARGKCPDWVMPLFQMTEETINA